jgi:TolB-like protein/Tfp pilus assembly protein PilF
VVIGVLLVAVIILAYPKIFHQGRSHIPREMRGKISIAVMPFKNVTGDTIFSLWQEGMQNLMITALSNSPELSVRQFETMNSAIASRKDINFASFSPSMIRKLAQQLEANTVISGSLHKSGDKIRITANIMNAGTEEIYKSYVLDGHTEDDFFALADSMSLNIRNFLEIRNMSRDSHFDTGEIFTQSADAYKLYIQGLNCHTQLDYVCAAENYNKAIQADTSFVSAMLKLAYCYGDMRQAELSKSWAYRAANHYDQLPPDMQILVNAVKAAVDKRPLVQLKYCRQYLDLDPHSNYMTYMTGWIHFNLEQWAEAIEAFEQSLELLNKLDSHPWSWTYILLGRAYHFEGLFKKESKIYETGRELWPDQSATFDYWEAISAVSQGDSLRATTLLGDIHKDLTRKGWPEANLMLWYAGVYAWADANDKAEEYYRKALSMRPENEQIMYEFANFLISHDRSVEEGMDLIAPLVEKYPANAQFLYVCGLGLSKQEKLQEARDVLNRAWELRPWYDHKHFVLSKKIDDLLNSV